MVLKVDGRGGGGGLVMVLWVVVGSRRGALVVAGSGVGGRGEHSGGNGYVVGHVGGMPLVVSWRWRESCCRGVIGYLVSMAVSLVLSSVMWLVVMA